MRRRSALFITFFIFIFLDPLTCFAKISEKPVQIDRLTKKAKFTLSWYAPDFQKSDFSLSLLSPSGERIDENNLPQNASILKVGSASAYAFNIYNPEAGRWMMLIKHPTGIKYTTGCAAKSSLKFGWSFIDPTPSINQPIIIEATLNEPEPVLGADISVTVKKYKIKSIEFDEYYLILTDDGTGNDKLASDGIYTATFYKTQEEGSCCFNVKAQGYSEKAGAFERKFNKCTVVSTKY